MVPKWGCSGSIRYRINYNRNYYYSRLRFGRVNGNRTGNVTCEIVSCKSDANDILSPLGPRFEIHKYTHALVYRCVYSDYNYTRRWLPAYNYRTPRGVELNLTNRYTLYYYYYYVPRKSRRNGFGISFCFQPPRSNHPSARSVIRSARHFARNERIFAFIRFVWRISSVKLACSDDGLHITYNARNPFLLFFFTFWPTNKNWSTRHPVRCFANIRNFYSETESMYGQARVCKGTRLRGSKFKPSRTFGENEYLCIIPVPTYNTIRSFGPRLRY